MKKKQIKKFRATGSLSHYLHHVFGLKADLYDDMTELVEGQVRQSEVGPADEGWTVAVRKGVANGKERKGSYRKETQVINKDLNEQREMFRGIVRIGYQRNQLIVPTYHWLMSADEPSKGVANNVDESHLDSE
jgi:hypothetical protein